MYYKYHYLSWNFSKAPEPTSSAIIWNDLTEKKGVAAGCCEECFLFLITTCFRLSSSFECSQRQGSDKHPGAGSLFGSELKEAGVREQGREKRQ